MSPASSSSWAVRVRTTRARSSFRSAITSSISAWFQAFSRGSTGRLEGAAALRADRRAVDVFAGAAFLVGGAAFFAAGAAFFAAGAACVTGAAFLADDVFAAGGDL